MSNGMPSARSARSACRRRTRSTVPGAIDAWCLLNREHGTKPLSEILEPAARAAEHGYVVTPRVAADWARNADKLRDPHHREGDAARTARRPRPATRCATRRWPARLRRIGREGREAFYEGAVARDIVNRLKELGGLHEEEDFAAQRSQWVEPIHASYRGYDVYECPPANQGLTALMILRTLEGYALGGDAFSEADRLHLIAEATKAAYYVRDNYHRRPRFRAGRCRDLPVRGMGRGDPPPDPARPRPAAAALGGARAQGHDLHVRRRSRRQRGARSSTRCSRRSAPASWRRKAASSCTIAAAASASIPGHPSAIAPSKRPFHTLIPGMLVKDGRAVMPFGVMGGQYQAVGHATFLHYLLDRGMDPQQAAEGPRVFAYQGVLADRAFRAGAGARRPRAARPRDPDARRADRRLPGDLDRPRPRRPDRRLRAAQGRDGARVLGGETQNRGRTSATPFRQCLSAAGWRMYASLIRPTLLRFPGAAGNWPPRSTRERRMKIHLFLSLG